MLNLVDEVERRFVPLLAPDKFRDHYLTYLVTYTVMHSQVLNHESGLELSYVDLGQVARVKPAKHRYCWVLELSADAQARLWTFTGEPNL